MDSIKKAIERAECFKFDTLKYYCPWCGLELTGNTQGSGHVNETEAWEGNDCEFSVGSTSIYGRHSEPISTRQVLDWRIAMNEKWLATIPTVIESTKRTVTELKAQRLGLTMER